METVPQIAELGPDADHNARRFIAAWNATRCFAVEDLEAGVVSFMSGLLVKFVAHAERGDDGPDFWQTIHDARCLLAKVQPAE